MSAAIRPLGKFALRAERKNREAVQELLDMVRGSKSAAELAEIVEEGYTIARVVRPMGGGRVQVTLQTGETDVSVPIAGSIKIKGKAGNKTDRANCMCGGDFIVIRGGLAAGKIPLATMNTIRECFTKCGAMLPHAFTESNDDGDFMFERADDIVGGGAGQPADEDELDIDDV